MKDIVASNESRTQAPYTSVRDLERMAWYTYRVAYHKMENRKLCDLISIPIVNYLFSSFALVLLVFAFTIYQKQL